MKPHKDSRWRAGWEARPTTSGAAHPQDELAALAARHATPPPTVLAAGAAAAPLTGVPLGIAHRAPPVSTGVPSGPPAGSWASAAGAASSWDPAQLSEADLAAQQEALNQFSSARPAEPSPAATGGSSSSSLPAETATSTKPSAPPPPPPLEATRASAAQTAAPLAEEAEAVQVREAAAAVAAAQAAAEAAAAKVITTKQLRAVRLLLQKRGAGVSIPIGSGSILEYVMQAMPEFDRHKVVAAAFGGKVPCKVFRWTELDLAVIMMNLGYFTKPPIDDGR